MKSPLALFKTFDRSYIWEYRVNSSGADIVYTNRDGNDTKTCSGLTLELAFIKLFGLLYD